MCADITRHLSKLEMRNRPLRGLSLYVENTGTIRGRGVFAAKSFSKGELVEVAPVIVFTSACQLPRIFADVAYSWDAETKAIALGYGSLYNHDNPANLSYQADASARVIRYKAIRDIKLNEELTINYSAALGRCDRREDDWFEKHGVAKLSSGSDGLVR
jgi:uncharacterized protein